MFQREAAQNPLHLIRTTTKKTGGRLRDQAVAIPRQIGGEVLAAKLAVKRDNLVAKLRKFWKWQKCNAEIAAIAAKFGKFVSTVF